MGTICASPPPHLPMGTIHGHYPCGALSMGTICASTPPGTIHGHYPWGTIHGHYLWALSMGHVVDGALHSLRSTMSYHPQVQRMGDSQKTFTASGHVGPVPLGAFMIIGTALNGGSAKGWVWVTPGPRGYVTGTPGLLPGQKPPKQRLRVRGKQLTTNPPVGETGQLAIQGGKKVCAPVRGAAPPAPRQQPACATAGTTPMSTAGTTPMSAAAATGTSSAAAATARGCSVTPVVLELAGGEGDCRSEGGHPGHNQGLDPGHKPGHDLGGGRAFYGATADGLPVLLRRKPALRDDQISKSQLAIMMRTQAMKGDADPQARAKELVKELGLTLPRDKRGCPGCKECDLLKAPPQQLEARPPSWGAPLNYKESFPPEHFDGRRSLQTTAKWSRAKHQWAWTDERWEWALETLYEVTAAPYMKLQPQLPHLTLHKPNP